MNKKPLIFLTVMGIIIFKIVFLTSNRIVMEKVNCCMSPFYLPKTHDNFQSAPIYLRTSPSRNSPSGICQNWDSIIDQEAKNENEAIWAKRVMRCESTCNPNAVNKSSGASGLFQIIPKWHPTMRDKVFDGEASIKYALKKYREGGAGLWVCK